MTIYKAKGLEFPVTIVPFHKWDASPDRDFTVQEYKGQRLLVPMKKDLGEPYFESVSRSVREQLNLLYVAWTRAREELYGFFTEKPERTPALAAMNLFLDLDDDVYELGQTPTGTIPSAPEPRTEPKRLAPSTGQPELMAWLPRLRVYRHNLEDSFFNERMRGEVAHRVMEHLRVTGPDTANDAADVDRAVRLAVADFPGLGALAETERTRLDAALRDMGAWALGQPDLRQWLASGEREPEIMDLDGEFKRLDLLVTTPEPTVIDFKTGQPDPHNEVQVRGYMDLLAAMPGFTEPRGYLVYLDRREIREVGRGA